MIDHGNHDLMMIMQNNETINATNYLKKDKNYIDILRMNWDSIYKDINNIFSIL